MSNGTQKKPHHRYLVILAITSAMCASTVLFYYPGNFFHRYFFTHISFLLLTHIYVTCSPTNELPRLGQTIGSTKTQKFGKQGYACKELSSIQEPGLKNFVLYHCSQQGKSQRPWPTGSTISIIWLKAVAPTIVDCPSNEP